MDRKRIGIVLVTIIVMLVLILSLPAVSGNSFVTSKGPGGKIVYLSDESGGREIYLLDLDKNDILRLTNNASEDYSPAYIPALNRIGFVSDREEGTNVFTMNLDGSDQQTVFPQSLLIDYPDWSPDGKWIAASFTEGCTEEEPACEFDLYILDPAQFLVSQLSDTVESEWVPQWSPDGQKIAFASDRDGDSEIYVIDGDGYNLVQLTNNFGYDGRPRWSPDGSMLSFETDQAGGDWDIFVMNADGSHPRAVTVNTDSDEWMQFWSPDGGWLVFVSNLDGDYEIYIIDVNGRNQQRLTSNDFSDESPVWIP